MASPNYYEVLGVSRKTAAREVRRAYRALARKFHPDFNPEDKAAAQKFREIQEAYEVLGNAQKRKAYDYYGTNFGQRIPTGNPQATEWPNVPPVGSPSDFPRYTPRGGSTTGPFWSSRFSPPATAKVTWERVVSVSVFAAVFIGGALLYFLWPNRGVREFRRAQEALRHVHSWKMEGRTVGPDSDGRQYLDEMSCPSSERLTQHLHGVAGGQPVEFTLEILSIGNESYTSYTHTDQSKAWDRGRTGEAGPANTCAKLSRGQDAGQLPPLGEWLSGSYTIEKEGLREATDNECREWKILSPEDFLVRQTRYSSA